MAFLDSFTQWNRLDTKSQTTNTTEMKFSTINNKRTKIRLLRYSFIFLTNG